MSDENLKDLPGKPGVGSFFTCCCYVIPSLLSKEDVKHRIYNILSTKGMFPSRGYEEKLKVEF